MMQTISSWTTRSTMRLNLVSIMWYLSSVRISRRSSKKGSIFLQEAYKEDYSVETLEKLVFPWVRSDWGDFSDLHNFVIEKKNIGLSSRVQYNDRHDIAYLKIFQNVFVVEQPHQIPDIWILNFVKKNEKYGWRIYGIGDKIADYKESGRILDWFEHIKKDK